jgi:undecaprenyl diphosphate synthase
VLGVMKAYTTRVGEGPFPTENDAFSDMLHGMGREFGATTGRARRCGWFDAVAVRYAGMINGIDDIAVTNLDGLDSLATIQICTHYKLGRKTLDVPPSDFRQLRDAKPVYIEMPGWQTPTHEARKYSDLPKNARTYLEKIASLTGAKLTIASVGPNRDQTNVPKHIAIIMDGNGRWAKERGLARIAGHEQGAESVRAVSEACVELGIDFLTVYAFSTENWKRPAAEVSALWMLLEHFIAQETPTMMKNGVRLQAIGRLHELPESCQTALRDAIALTSQNKATTLILALNYSGRTEIIDAVRDLSQKVASGAISPEAVQEELFSQHLYTRDYPDPDLLIRTSGEMRLSNFLLWQLSYTEIYVTQKMWPDFGKEDLREAIGEYNKRQRRFGGL